MTLKPWREIAIPHEDVLKGTFQQAEFAADLSRVHAGTATPEYQDPSLFYQRTFITEGMRLLLDSVIKRLAGKGGDPVIQLQTAFGGGKTHTMLAVYHLARGEAPVSQMPGLSTILDASGITELPRARVAVLDGIKSSPNQPIVRDGLTLRTLWGDLAWQLGGAEGYALVADADASGTSPGKAVLETLLSRCAPCVILIDELVAYVRQFEEGKTLTGGSFDSNLSFIQALTEALKAVPTAVLLASLPESDKEAGSQRGVKALEALSHYFGRIQALWKPVATEEAFEIVRRRLFTQISDRLAAEAVCRAFADFYTANRNDFPQETQESRYFERLQHAYPIHPEVFDRLYEDWSSLDNFQRTRGVLKLMAKVIHRLWKDGNNDPMIMPGSLPLYDGDTRNDIIYYLPQGWDPVMDKDVDGERAETTEIENQDTRFGSIQACRRSARTIFLGSAPSTANQLVRGIELERVLLGAVLPGQQLGAYKDAIHRINDRLHYLNHANNRFWFDTRPNLRREMEERKRRFQDKEDVIPAIRDRVQKSFASGLFAGVHVFTPSADIPDDWQMRLVVLPPDAYYSRSGHSVASDRALEILKKRGDQPRFKQNRLIFLAPDYDSVARLRDLTRSMLAWQSIVNDIKEMKLNLDQFQARQASKSLDEANETVRRMVRETYKWLLAPVQDAKPGKGLSEIQWEAFPVNPGAASLTQEIERVLKENELLITEWAPVHLLKVLKDWFWKDGVQEVSALNVWQQTCQQLYLPRLLNDHVFHNTVQSGAESRDFFGLDQGKDEQRYVGFSFGERTSIYLDTVLLIEPSVAKAYADAVKEPPPLPPPDPRIPPGTPTDPPQPPLPLPPDPKPVNRHFYGTIDLDPVRAKMQFADIVDEVVQQFTTQAGVKVRIAIEIQAESVAGFDDGLQRAVRENCNVLNIKGEFERGDA
jgi:predicted AAA+ superfamily ATPase